MDDQRPEDATKLAALPRHSAMPYVCVADPRQQMRMFLAETLQDLGCVSRKCADVSELGALLVLRLPDLVVIGGGGRDRGLRDGGIARCQGIRRQGARAWPAGFAHGGGDPGARCK